EFCIPTSIEIAFWSEKFNFNNFAAKYPIARPSTLCKTTTAKTISPSLMILSVLTATTAAATATIPATETSGNAVTLFSTCRWNSKRTIIPSTIGNSTIFTIDINMSPADTGNHLLAKSNVSVGVRIGASNVETVVTVTDKDRKRV